MRGLRFALLVFIVALVVKNAYYIAVFQIDHHLGFDLSLGGMVFNPFFYLMGYLSYPIVGLSLWIHTPQQSQFQSKLHNLGVFFLLYVVVLILGFQMLFAALISIILLKIWFLRLLSTIPSYTREIRQFRLSAFVFAVTSIGVLLFQLIFFDRIFASDLVAYDFQNPWPSYLLFSGVTLLLDLPFVIVLLLLLRAIETDLLLDHLYPNITTEPDAVPV